MTVEIYTLVSLVLWVLSFITMSTIRKLRDEHDDWADGEGIFILALITFLTSLAWPASVVLLAIMGFVLIMKIIANSIASFIKYISNGR